MSGTFILSTTSEGHQTLGSAAQRSYELVTGTLRARIDTAAGDLFAEPVTTGNGGGADWYAPVDGRVRPLSALSAAEADAVRADLASRITAILALADELAASKASDGFWLSDALRNAVEVPDETAIWTVQSGSGPILPVLINWSRIRDDRQAVRGTLTGLTGRIRQPGVVPSSATPAVAAANFARPAAIGVVGTEARSWDLSWLLALGWLLLALLVAMILWLLIAPCGLRPGFMGGCGGGEADVTWAESRGLMSDIARLEAQFASKGQSCSQAAVPRPAAAASVPADAELDRRLAERSKAIGAALTFSLIWDGTDDLDLHVVCPAGDTVSFRTPISTVCNGTLDVDANYPAEKIVADPVENIVFAQRVPGAYTAMVRRAVDRSPLGVQSFTLVIRDATGLETRVDGTVSAASTDWTHQENIAP